MKIITNEAVYVQMRDIIFLNLSDLPIPEFVIMKLFESNNDSVIVDGSNRASFIKFDNENEIDYFEELDWIVDYNAVKDLSQDELKSYRDRVAEERNTIASWFKLLSEEEQDENYDLIDKCNLLDYKIRSLDDISAFKNGELDIILPPDVEYPKDYKPLNIVEKVFRKIKRRIK